MELQFVVSAWGIMYIFLYINNTSIMRACTFISIFWFIRIFLLLVVLIFMCILKLIPTPLTVTGIWKILTWVIPLRTSWSPVDNYELTLPHKIQSVLKTMRWKLFFEKHIYEHINRNETTSFGFKSQKIQHCMMSNTWTSVL